MADTTLTKAKPSNLATANQEAPQAGPETTSYAPRADIYETDTEIVLECDLPGVKAEDVELQFDRGVLSLHGTVHPRPQAGDAVSSEYGIGDFYRTFSIPVEIDSTKLSAECKLGVLTVHLPKHERAQSHKITVKAG